MLVGLDRTDSEPLYLQIKNQIRDLIWSGDLPVGARLPPERELAASLEVNRTTVSSAYSELAADGLVVSHVGRRTVVCPPARVGGPGRESPAPQPLPWAAYFLGERAQDPLIQELVALCAQEDVISLAGGVPAPDLYPVERFAQAMDTVLRRHGRTLLQCCPTEGHLDLRIVLAEMAGKRGITTLPENVLVLSGSQKGSTCWPGR